MKKVFILAISLAGSAFFSSCKKCIEPTPCVPTIAACNDTVPTQLCQAYFTRWFYDKSTNSCKQIGYSGCDAKGFATQAECEACKCNQQPANTP